MVQKPNCHVQVEINSPPASREVDLQRAFPISNAGPPDYQAGHIQQNQKRGADSVYHAALAPARIEQADVQLLDDVQPVSASRKLTQNLAVSGPGRYLDPPAPACRTATNVASCSVGASTETTRLRG